MVTRKTLSVIALTVVICSAVASYAFFLHYTKAHEHTIKIAFLMDIEKLNDLDVLNTMETTILDLICDPLTEPNPVTLKHDPFLAEEVTWEKVDTPFPECIVRLRKNAKWHDGVPVTAEDVKFWFELQKELKVPKFYSQVAYIKSIKILDDHKLKFVSIGGFTLPFGNLIFPKHLWEPILMEARKTSDPLIYMLEYPNPPLIGCGEAKFVEMVPGSYIKLEIDKEWYFGKMQIDGIMYVKYHTLDEAVDALKKGEVDTIMHPLEPKHVMELEGDPKVTIRRNPTRGLYHMAFNMRREPFGDLSFRKAVTYLVDRPYLARELLGDMGEPLYSTVPPSYSFWHNPNVTTYNLASKEERIAKAREILSDANYTWVDGKLIMPNGKPVKAFDLLTPTMEYDPIRARAGLMIAEWLSQIGVSATAKQLALNGLTEKMLWHDFHMYVSAWELPLGLYYLYQLFHSSNAVPGGFNTPGYCSQEFDDLIVTEEKELIPEMDETRRQLGLRVQEIIARDLPVIPLYNLDVFEAYRNDRFEGWVDMLGGIMNSWSYAYIYPVKD